MPERDTVVELAELPQSSIGAPLPVVVASEHRLQVAYLLELDDPDWDGTYVRVVSPQSPGERVAAVEFEQPYAHYLGAPNDEAFAGHPLAGRGVAPYGAFEVRGSSWIAALETMIRVHPYHKPAPFNELRHFILAFHDSTFECVARGLTVGEHAGPSARVVMEMAQRVGE